MSLLNLRLVDDADKVHTYSSTQLAAALGAISLASPFVTAFWAGIPEEVKSLLPNSWRLAIAIFIGCMAIIAARYTTNAPKKDNDVPAAGSGVTSFGPVMSCAGGNVSEAVDGDASAAAK